MRNHLFDDLVKSIALDTTSRRVFTGGSLAILLCASRATARKKKKGGKGKGNGKKPNHKRPSHLGPPIPGEDDCDAFFLGEPELQKDCKTIRETCDAPRHLCLHAIDSAGNDDRGVSCCPGQTECCIYGCTDTSSDNTSCGECGNPCRDDQVCRDSTCTCPTTCPRGKNCLNGSGTACRSDDTDCRCWCGPHFKYCPNLNGGVCASPNADC